MSFKCCLLIYEQKFVMDQLCQENLLFLQICRNTSYLVKYEFKSYDYHTLRLTVFSALNIIWNTFLMSCNFEYISNVLYFSLRSLVSCSHLIGNILEVHEFLMNSDATWKILTIKELIFMLSTYSRVRNKNMRTLINIWGFFQGLRPY